MGIKIAAVRVALASLLVSGLVFLTGCSPAPQQTPPAGNPVTTQPAPSQDLVEQENLLFDCIRYKNGFLEGHPGSVFEPWRSFLAAEWHAYTGNPTIGGNYYQAELRSKTFSEKWEQLVSSAGIENLPDLSSAAVEFQVICLVSADVSLEIG